MVTPAQLRQLPHTHYYIFDKKTFSGQTFLYTPPYSKCIMFTNLMALGKCMIVYTSGYLPLFILSDLTCCALWDVHINIYSLTDEKLEADNDLKQKAAHFKY